jgi:carboxylate-amine ligase
MKQHPEIKFQQSKPYTLGVEIEFQVLDKNTLNLAPLAPEILDMVPAELKDRIKPEFIRSMIEVNTDICESVQHVKTNLAEMSQQAERLARDNGCLLYAASLHPFANHQDQILSPDPRYSRIINDLQLVGRHFIAQGLHIHVGMPDPETAVLVRDNILTYIPILLALTTSSPFYEGIDTGLSSYRTKLFEALPLAGMPDQIGSWEKYLHMVNLLINTGIINEVRDLWWDVRLHPDFGTVEIRICDLPSRFMDILAIVTLIQALVATLAESEAHLIPDMQIVKSNKWQAARYGLHGRFVNPLTQCNISMLEAATDMFEMTAPKISKFETNHFITPLLHILENGTSADLQRKIYQETGDFSAIIKEILPRFWQ